MLKVIFSNIHYVVYTNLLDMSQAKPFFRAKVSKKTVLKEASVGKNTSIDLSVILAF